VVFKKLPATNYPPAKFGKFTEYLQPLCHGQTGKKAPAVYTLFALAISRRERV
jgi:hypothetical protein